METSAGSVETWSRIQKMICACETFRLAQSSGSHVPLCQIDDEE